MNRSAEREAVILRGLLQGGGFFAWRVTDSRSIYVGSDPRCEWRVTGHGVAPFHLQLCWYGNRLWMAELGGQQRTVPGLRWTMAPMGVAVRLGSVALVLEVASDLSTSDGPPIESPYGHGAPVHGGYAPTQAQGGQTQGGQARGGQAQGAINLRTAAIIHVGSGSSDPDATLMIEAEELRALPSFGPAGPPSGMAPGPGPMAPASVMAPMPGFESARPAGPALEEMFIIPAEKTVAAAPVKKSVPLGRIARVVPIRSVIALVVAGGLALVTFLPESLHANRNNPPPATLPPRRPPPTEVVIEVHGVKPVIERSAAESVAARDLAAGRLDEALLAYRELQKEAPDDPVFRDFVIVVERRIKARCLQGNCPDEKAAEVKP